MHSISFVKSLCKMTSTTCYIARNPAERVFFQEEENVLCMFSRGRESEDYCCRQKMKLVCSSVGNVVSGPVGGLAWAACVFQSSNLSLLPFLCKRKKELYSRNDL
jgi:hypothetical protein